MSKKIVIIGGSAAGPKAAARARRIDPAAEVILIQKGEYFSMASCGYPYYVGGVFDDRNKLISTPTGVVRDPKFFLNAKNIDARSNTEAVKIDPSSKSVTVKTESDDEETIDYDKLIIATGAIPVLPPLPGIDLEGIVTLQSMKDADYLRKIRDEKKIKQVVIVGGGLIGIETCEALQLAGIKVILVEMLDNILSFMDPQLAALVENHMKAKGVDVLTGNRVSEFLGADGKVSAVKLGNGTELSCELAVIAIGVKPNVALAQTAGIKIGSLGGIVTDEYMRTNVNDIYAVGDCIEVKSQLTGQNILTPYGDLANLQGRAAGENAASEDKATFPGSIQTGICKVFDFGVGSTGLTEKACCTDNKDIVSVVTAGPDKPGFMDGKPLMSKIIAEKSSGRLIGYQCVGMGDVSKQIAQAAVAIKGNLKIDDLVNLDLPYAPPYQLAIDHFIAAAHTLQNKANGLFEGISAEEVKAKIDAKEKTYILDVRGPDEYETMRLGIGEVLIPLGALRKRADDLPQDKSSEIITYCKISLRGYEAARILHGMGYSNVKVLEGGILAWPYPREK